MPQELPGFYYDPEKNRYFPIKGSIPGSRSQKLVSTSKLDKHQENSQQSTPKKEAKTTQLLQLRELYGKVLNNQSYKYTFQHEYEKKQASQSMIWKYKDMERIVNGGLEHVHIDMQTSDGQITTQFLLIGNMGGLNLYEVEQVGMHYDYGFEFVPYSILPSITENQAVYMKAPKLTWMPGGQKWMDSTISSIKAIGNRSSTTDDAVHAVISTLGSGTSGGSVYIMKINEPLDLNHKRRIFEVASINSTIWTADTHPDRSQAVIGTDRGAAMVNIETGAVSWLCLSRSDVLSQQFSQSGNVILCGFRNGAILTVDVRQKQQQHTIPLHTIPFSSNTGYKHSSRNAQKRTKGCFKLKGSIQPSCTIFMPSSISSLVTLQTDDQYFLASSMDGSIKLYDHRLIERGPIQSYEGHVNSHTRIQLGVDPSERIVMSGGEDGKVHKWSIKTGELLFGTKLSRSALPTLCWPRTGMKRMSAQTSKYEEGAWVASAAELFYIRD